MSVTSERDQFAGAVQEIQTLFFNVFAKYENHDAEQSKSNDLIEALKSELARSEKKRAEIQSKYTNLRVSYSTFLQEPQSNKTIGKIRTTSNFDKRSYDFEFANSRCGKSISVSPS